MNYRIEIRPPDIEPYRQGNAGVEFVHVLDSGKPGPNVMVQALTHGNELCGAYALDFLFREHVKPNRGKLVLAFANVAAFARRLGRDSTMTDAFGSDRRASISSCCAVLFTAARSSAAV